MSGSKEGLPPGYRVVKRDGHTRLLRGTRLITVWVGEPAGRKVAQVAWRIEEGRTAV